MGRPKEFDQETVLNAATHCIWADGVLRTSISSLVEAMKIQRSSFYNSFSSREGILELVLAQYMRQSPLNKLTDTEENIDLSEEPDLKVVDLILDFCHFLANEGQGRGCLFINGLCELKSEHGLAYEIFQDRYLQLTDGLTQILSNVSNAYPKDSSDKLLPYNVLCILIGLSHYSKLDQNEQRLTQMGLNQLAALSPVFAARIEKGKQGIQESVSFAAKKYA